MDTKDGRSSDWKAANKTYKDSVFTKYMSEDPKRLISVYNALSGSSYPLDTKIEINTLQDTLFRERINDLSFVVDNKLVVLIEHQSTINNNMPIRMLIYAARIYEKMLDPRAEYRAELMDLPTPQFYVLYNGKRPYPDHTVLHLSDAFVEKSKLPSIEVTVNVFNINSGHSPDILRQCNALNEYSKFVQFTYDEQKRRRADAGKDDQLWNALDAAIRYCIDNNIMSEFFQRHGSEVLNMLYNEWKMEDALETKLEEGRQEGAKSFILGLRNMLTPKEIAEMGEIPLAVVNKILDSNPKPQI